MNSESAHFDYVCLSCGVNFAQSFEQRCPRCDGAIEIIYHRPPRIRAAETHPLRRYIEFLPIADAEAAIWLGCEEPTPCSRAPALGDAIGIDHLYIKNETVHPTRTTKDRMASVTLSLFRELGILEFSASSTGNSSTALAHGAVKHPEFTLHLFCGEAFLSAMNWPDVPNIHLYAMAGATFVDAAAVARDFGRTRGFLLERGFFNPARREGLKTAFLEAAEQINRPVDWYVQAVSSGMGVLGVAKGAGELLDGGVITRRPRLLCAQQDGCAPMARAYRDGHATLPPEYAVEHPSGPARAILRGDPTHAYPYMHNAVAASNGTFEIASAEQIAAARALVLESEGINCCAASACAVAGLQNAVIRGTVARDETVLVSLTGADREPADPPRHAVLQRGADGWMPAD